MLKPCISSFRFRFNCNLRLMFPYLTTEIFTQGALSSFINAHILLQLVKIHWFSNPHRKNVLSVKWTFWDTSYHNNMDLLKSCFELFWRLCSELFLSLHFVSRVQFPVLKQGALSDKKYNAFKNSSKQNILPLLWKHFNDCYNGLLFSFGFTQNPQ